MDHTIPNTSFRLLFHSSCYVSGQRELRKQHHCRAPVRGILMPHPAPRSTATATADTHLSSSPAHPLCRFCSRQDRQFRVSGPLAFQQMQKMPSSKAARQASAQRAPRRGALKEMLSEKHMNFTFCIIAWEPAIVFRTYLVSSHLPPALHLPFLPGLQTSPVTRYKQRTTGFLPGRWGRKSRPEPKSWYTHTTPSLFSPPSRPAPAQTGQHWYSSLLAPASAPPEGSCPSQAVCPSALFISKRAKFFWQDSPLSFPPPASCLLAALVPSLQTQEVFRLTVFWYGILFAQ